MTLTQLQAKADLWLVLHGYKDFLDDEIRECKCQDKCKFFKKCLSPDFTRKLRIEYQHGCIKWLDDK